MTALKKKLLFLFLFTVVGFITLQIPFNKVLGSNVSFTIFDFFGPMAGGFLGPVFGIGSVFAVEIINLFIKQTPLTTGTVIRLFPTLFAVYYFAVIAKKGSNSRWILAVPVLCILAFIIHPIGRQVAYYPLIFWWIPIAAYFKKDNLFLKSLGATFTAHAVGSTAFLWALNLPVAIWQSLPPIVVSERFLFASGIAVSYVIVKHSLSYLVSKRILPKPEFTTL